MNTKWLIKNWFRVGHKISWKLSFETLISLLYFNPHFQNDFIYRIVEKKHRFVLDYLKSNCPEVLSQFESVKDETGTLNRKFIWVMWWQGEEKAPELVKLCISSMRKNANGAEVIVINKDNYKEWADIPDYIIEKHIKGYISFAQLSDIMRIFLISKHGGLWLDSTIYVSQPIPQTIFHKSFYSLHTKFKRTPFVQNDRIHCFVLGGNPGSKIIQFEKSLLSAYWKTHDVIVDYYLLDYSIMLAYWTFSDVHETIDSLDYTSEGLYQLVEILDAEYSPAMLEQVLSENLFSKLVWNQKHNTEHISKETNYMHLLELNGFPAEGN